MALCSRRTLCAEQAQWDDWYRRTGHSCDSCSTSVYPQSHRSSTQLGGGFPDELVLARSSSTLCPAPEATASLSLRQPCDNSTVSPWNHCCVALTLSLTIYTEVASCQHSSRKPLGTQPPCEAIQACIPIEAAVRQ